jgi:hypothetical protein
MPNICVMNWNIQKLSDGKIQILGMSQAIARTVVASNVDILIIVELVKAGFQNTMTNLTAAAGVASANPSLVAG